MIIFSPGFKEIFNAIAGLLAGCQGIPTQTVTPFFNTSEFIGFMCLGQTSSFDDDNLRLFLRKLLIIPQIESSGMHPQRVQRDF
jgi:hypothetical protein